MSELPKGWVETTLGDLVAFNPKLTLDDDTEIGFVPMSHAPTNFRDKLNYDTRSWGEVRKAYTHFANGDVIFAKVTPCFENGKAAIVSGLPNASGAGSSEFHVLRPVVPEISPTYLLAVIKSAEFLRDGEAAMTGAVGLRRVPRSFVETFPVRLPPAAEQARIAQALDGLLAQVDTLKAGLDALPALIKRFRQSVLSAAVSGQLTEEWRSALKKTYQWQSVPVGAICSSAFDGPFGSKLKSDDYTTKGVRVVRLENVGHLRFINEKKTYISFDKHADLSKNTLATGDILFSSFVDEEIRVCLLPGSKEKFINKADCFCLRIDCTSASPNFVAYALAAKSTYQRIKKSVHGATRPRVNLGFLKSFELDLPSLEEQSAIVRRVEQLFAFADQLEARLADARARVDALTQSILAKAFRGELVPQDPNDEPASILLERITAQRATTPKPKRGRKSV